MYKRIPVEIKNEVLQKVRNGEKVIDLARLYGIGDKTIYQWLKESVKQEVSIWEHRRIKAENEELKRILGMVMLELERKKKGGDNK
ncbi:MAG: transposase [Candidatus Dojkabacteria bacterium]